MKNLVDVQYTDVIVIRVVLDNLNTHNESSFFENLGKKEAHRILRKLEFHYVPKHASWLNVAETEIGIMDAQCTDRRIKDRELLTREVNAWTVRWNRQKRKIEWTFTKQKADEKLGKYYVI
ncbi:transposase [mine drainage metagenome]|uniref:Transposase n=1 Tax=mine drainage metagenome TaxID=410659 RepID=T1AQP9_9ZZZZ